MEKKSHKTFVHPLVIRVLKSYIYKYQMCVRFHAENSCLWLQGTAWWKIVEEIQKSSVTPCEPGTYVDTLRLFCLRCTPVHR